MKLKNFSKKRILLRWRYKNIIFRKEIHEGVIRLYVECNDPEDTEYNTGCHVEENILKKYGLNPGDSVQYKILKDRTVKIIGRIKISKTITPI